jgi:enamine deaminase RidA (YjgF/YER057c/UK114 family)
LQRLNDPGLAPAVGFTHAVVGDAAGRTVFLAGQTATDAGGGLTGVGIVAQFETALRNLLTALASAGGNPADLATLTVYAVDLEDYKAHARELGAVWRRLAGRDYPAMAAVGVTRLWDSAAVVELQGVAVLPPLG